VAGTAYRAGKKLYDRRLDQVFDYSRRSGALNSILKQSGLKK